MVVNNPLAQIVDEPAQSTELCGSFVSDPVHVCNMQCAAVLELVAQVIIDGFVPLQPLVQVLQLTL